MSNDIVSLRRYPGDPILVKGIAAQFGVSRTPVSAEAILRCRTEKLIEILPQSGNVRCAYRARYAAGGDRCQKGAGGRDGAGGCCESQQDADRYAAR